MASKSMLLVKPTRTHQLIFTPTVVRFSLTVFDSGQFCRRDIDLIDGGSIVIGRSSKSDHKLQPSSTNCRFDCPVVSRAHAELLCNEGQLSIRDTGSLHGTFVNQQELVHDTTVVLQDGDIITLGAEVLRAHGKNIFETASPWKLSLTSQIENYQAIRLAVNYHRPCAAERLLPTYAYESDLVDEDNEDDEEDVGMKFGANSCSSFDAHAVEETPKRLPQSKAPATLATPEAVQESYPASVQPLYTWYDLANGNSRTITDTSCDALPLSNRIDDELDSDDAEEELIQLSDDSDDSESDSEDEQITTSMVVDTTSSGFAEDEVKAPQITTVAEADQKATMSALADRLAEREALFAEQESVLADRAKWAQDQMDKFNNTMVSSLPTPPTTHTHSSGQWYDPVRSAHEEGRPVVTRDTYNPSYYEGLVPAVATPVAAATNLDVSPVQDGIPLVLTICDELKKRKHNAVEDSSSTDEQPVTKKMVPARSEQQKPQARRLRTLPNRATVRKVATQATQVAVGAVLGMVGTVAFLSSPYAEQLIQWLD
jgi:hypothetical protein